MDRREATKFAQTQLKSSGKALVVDGFWGPRTDTVFVSAPQALQDLVVATAVRNGFRDEEQLRGKYFGSAETNVGIGPSSRWISSSAMAMVISRVSGVTSVGADVLRSFLELEAAKKMFGGEMHYDKEAINAGGYRGLYQFDSRGNAWKDASRFVSDLPAFEPAWKDAYYNTLAAAGYVKFNTSVVRTRGYKGAITGNVAYLMHNQGAVGALRVLQGQTIVGSQSANAMKVASAAVMDSKSIVG